MPIFWLSAGCSTCTSGISQTAATRARTIPVRTPPSGSQCGIRRRCRCRSISYIDSWHGVQAMRWIEQYDRSEPFFLFVGFPGPHDPWDAPREAVDRYRDVEVSMPSSTRRPTVDGTGRYGALLNSFLWLSDTETMTDDAIRGMRRAYGADISIIDDAVGHIVTALEAKGLLDKTWVIYTSDHGEMGGNHGLMSKCVLYQPAVRVPLIVRPPQGCPPQVVDALIEHIDVPATVRDIAGAPELPAGEGRSLLGYTRGDVPLSRSVSISENWGFASFETEQYKIIVDEDAGFALPALQPARRPGGGSRPPPRSGIDVDRRSTHGDLRPTVLPHAARSPAQEHLHGMIGRRESRRRPNSTLAPRSAQTSPRHRSRGGRPRGAEVPEIPTIVRIERTGRHDLSA